MEQSSAGHGVPKIMVFRPTWDEFKDFNKFILHMEEKGAHKAGLAKIIPPPEWKPRRDDYDMDYIGKIKIPAPICQVVTGKQGLYQQINIQKKPMTVKEFRELAESERYRTPLHEDFEELERKYWKNVTFVSPIYGADVSGSLTDPDVDEWNINRLGSVLDYVNTDYGISIEGVNTAYLYFGMWKTTFAWHTEDMDLYSINFLHFGAPKSWYCIPPEHGRRLERLANGFFSSNYKSCPAYLRHKMTLISPQILKQYSIPFNRITQEAGEIMVTFPYGYHAGFNHGFNCAESTNFASPRWVEYGKRTVHCHCRKDMVKISMDTFVKRFQADRYELWITGKDIGPHPEDPNKLYAASAPSIDDILCNKNNEDVPETFFEAVEKREAKRHPIHKKKVFDKEEFEVKLKDLIQVDDEDDPVPDEETMEVMKDIWIKADESDDPDFSLDEFTSKSKRKSKGKSKKKDKPKKKIERKKSSEILPPKPESKRLTIKLENIATTSQRIPDVKKVLLPSSGSKLLNFRIPKTVVELDSLTPKRNYEDAFDTPGGETPEKATPSTSSLPKSNPESNSRYYQEVNHRNFSNWGQSMRKAMANSLSTSSQPPSASSALAKMQLMVETTPPRVLDPKSETAQTLAKLKATPAVTVTLQTLAEANARQSLAFVKPIVSIDPVTPQREVSGPRSQPQTPYFQPQTQANGSGYPYFPSRTEPEQNTMTSRDLNLRQQWWPGITGASETKAPELKPEVPEGKEGEVGAGIGGESCPPPPILVRQDQDTSRREGGSYGEVERRKARKQKSPRSFKLAEVPGVGVGWASSLTFLWQRQNVNLRKEADFNFFGSQMEPFCAICALFTEARHLKCEFEATSWRESQSVLMHSHSQVWVHEENYYPRGTTVRKNERKAGWEFKMSALLRCSQCRLCVHAKCYGQPEPSHKGAWLCQRCQEKDLQAVCCLCLWRGGALKRTAEGGWAHISCALTIPEVTFGDVVRREPIHVEHVSSERLQLPCNYCQDLGPERARGGACVQCSIGRCAQWFHPMCGWAAGVRFVDGGFTQPIRARCTCHRSERHNTSPRHRGRPPPVNVDDTVLAPHPNGGHFYARVLNTKEEEFYWLDFMDGSTSKDTFPEDIVDLDCRRNGPPEINSQVKIKWTDGLVYDGIYRGSNMKCVYTMKFQDGSMACLEREKFYSASEELPKSIRDQLPFVMPL